MTIREYIDSRDESIRPRLCAVYDTIRAAISRTLSSAALHRLPGLRHGEFSLNHADRYADAVRQIVRV